LNVTDQSHHIHAVCSRLSVLTWHGTIVPVSSGPDVSGFEGRRRLRSSGHSQLYVPRYSPATMDRQTCIWPGSTASMELASKLLDMPDSLEIVKQKF